MKHCNKCHLLLSLDEFHKNNRCVDGRATLCKDCVRRSQEAYYQTPNGFLIKMYTGLSSKSKDRNHPPPNFDKLEFMLWAKEEGFDSLFQVWLSLGQPREITPSVDRLNSTFPYTINNIRLVTWRENNEAAYTERKSCARVTRQCKTVNQYALDGAFIKEYLSIANAARENSFCRTNINTCALGKAASAHGFVWKYGELGVANISTPRDV